MFGAWRAVASRRKQPGKFGLIGPDELRWRSQLKSSSLKFLFRSNRAHFANRLQLSASSSAERDVSY